LISCEKGGQGHGHGHKAKRKELNDNLDNSDVSDHQIMMELFQKWKEAHNVTFTDDFEEKKAFNTLWTNAKKVKGHREHHKRGKRKFQLELNQYSHLTFEEFKGKLLGYIPLERDPAEPGETMMERRAQWDKRQISIRGSTPASVNWTARGYVTSVKDQGHCGSCWTFSTTGVLEGAYYKATGKLIEFSQQELVECHTPFRGCNGGQPASAIDFIKLKGGIASGATYPYTSQNEVYSPTCRLSKAKVIAMKPTRTWLRTDAALLQAVATVGPIAVAVAVGEPFQFYESGIIEPDESCEDTINHAVLLVGYGTDPDTQETFWLVKNSWSTAWGEEGYFRLSGDVINSCGITDNALKVTVQAL